MKVGKAIKILEQNGFIFLNQVGSHKKFGKGSQRITIPYHSKLSETLPKYIEKELLKLVKK